MSTTCLTHTLLISRALGQLDVTARPADDAGMAAGVVVTVSVESVRRQEMLSSSRRAPQKRAARSSRGTRAARSVPNVAARVMVPGWPGRRGSTPHCPTTTNPTTDHQNNLVSPDVDHVSRQVAPHQPSTGHARGTRTDGNRCHWTCRRSFIAHSGLRRDDPLRLVLLQRRRLLAADERGRSDPNPELNARSPVAASSWPLSRPHPSGSRRPPRLPRPDLPVHLVHGVALLVLADTVGRPACPSARSPSARSPVRPGRPSTQPARSPL